MDSFFLGGISKVPWVLFSLHHGDLLFEGFYQVSILCLDFGLGLSSGFYLGLSSCLSFGLNL
jgi:hypothetical protein